MIFIKEYEQYVCQTQNIRLCLAETRVILGLTLEIKAFDLRLETSKPKKDDQDWAFLEIVYNDNETYIEGRNFACLIELNQSAQYYLINDLNSPKKIWVRAIV